MKDVSLSASQIRYLVSLYRLSGEGIGVKSAELASALGLSRPSVHNMLRVLCAMELLEQESFGLAHLTESGRVLAEKYVSCLELLKERMHTVLDANAVSESALCALLAELSQPLLEHLYLRAREEK